MEKILTVNDVAAILQVKAITVREMFREKRLRGFKVGKAWRTTETMLKEDIEALARGESPAELPSPEVRNPAPGAAKPVVAKAAPVPPAATKTTASPEPETDDGGKADTRPKKKKVEKVPTGGTSSGEDDTQQMLF